MAARRLRRAAGNTERRVLQELRCTTRSAHTRRSRLLALCIAAVALLATGCSNTAAGPTTSTNPLPAASTSTTSPTSTTTATSGEDAAVLTAYGAAWAAFEAALKDANPASPSLPAAMVNPILEQVKKSLVSDEVGGIVATGGVTLEPRVVSVNASTAHIADCLYSTSELIYRKSGKPVPPVTKPEHDGVTATLVLVGSTWKVKQQTVTDGKCSAGL
jgi:hypothetical protein